MYSHLLNQAAVTPNRSDGLAHHLSVSSSSISNTFPSLVMISYGAAAEGVTSRGTGIERRELTPRCMWFRNHVAKEYHGFRERIGHDPREFLAL